MGLERMRWKVLGSWCGCYNKDFHERHVVWSLPATSKDVGKHKAPGNRTYNEASDPVTGQAEGMATPYTAEDAAKSWRNIQFKPK